MQMRDTGLGFSPITIGLHWLIAAAVAVMVWLGLSAGQTDAGAAKAELVAMHSTLGTALFAVAAYRLWARLTSYHPLPVGTPNPIEVMISRSVAVALALAPVLLPLDGWLAMSAAGDVVRLPGGIALPAIVAPNPEVEYFARLLHKIGAYAFLAGLALHIFGAMKNHFVLKNDTLKRMLGKRVEL
ncbi:MULTISPECIES: cytochrome b/b6 domain-containing protein [unclassified Cupriavidus]|uniref:cytochrome b n=1 Tax=unclassified Cupriavidus TaxID=2640874 RepID=UPI00041FB0B8|nr:MULTISPECIES: cytochrome b/b6 domain-containing protein [unclassified Cupriavidus]MBP0632172.1 cytochrome b/b6 domain-containing protein [Cupriavidus sp. AcVe19-1a]